MAKCIYNSDCIDWDECDFYMNDYPGGSGLKKYCEKPKNIEFSGIIECNCNFTLEHLTLEERLGINKFLEAIKNNGGCFIKCSIEFPQDHEIKKLTLSNNI